MGSGLEATLLFEGREEEEGTARPIGRAFGLWH